MPLIAYKAHYQFASMGYFGIKCAQFNHLTGFLPVILTVKKKSFDNIRVTRHIPRPLIIPCYTEFRS